jgi:transposase
VGCYLGLQPGRRNSGQSEPQMHIGKEGGPYLRTLLVQGAQHMLGPFGVDCVYLETDDASAAASALKRNGVPLVKDVHETAWGTREFVVKDDQGHTLYFGERR